MKVIHIDHNCVPEKLDDLLLLNSDCQFIHYRHENELKEGESLITEARKDKDTHALLISLANRGFYLYATKDSNTSSFVQHVALPKLWKKISSGEAFYNDNGLVYSFDREVKNPSGLLVVFSSINAPIYKISLDRIFTKNFKSIGDYIKEDTLIMRIADLGGVTGSYYLNSKYLPNNEKNIQNLIRHIKNEYCVEKVVLLGASKGGSAAFYHGLLGGYDFVAVDPIVTDEFYFNKYNDLHFMRGIADISKEDSFASLLRESAEKCNFHSTFNRILITSKRSPQFNYIKKIVLDKYGDKFSIFINTDPEIKNHPDVSPKSLFKTTSLVGDCLGGKIIRDEIQYFMGNEEIKNKIIESEYVIQSKSNEIYQMPSNWKDELALIAKESRTEAVEYLDEFRKKKYKLIDLYYWHYAINLRALKQYKQCEVILNEGEEFFPNSKILKESKGALYFDLRNYSIAFDCFAAASKLRKISEKSFAKFLFSALIFGVVDDVKYVCQKYLEHYQDGKNLLAYYFLFNWLSDEKKINIENSFVVKILTDVFLENKISIKDLDFIAERIKIEALSKIDIRMPKDIPNSKYREFLSLYGLSKNIFSKKLFLNVSFLLFMEKRVLKASSLSGVKNFIFNYFNTVENFLSEIEKFSILEKKAIVYVLYRVGDFNLACLIRKQLCETIEFSAPEKDLHTYMLARADADLKRANDFTVFSEALKNVADDWVKNIYPYLTVRSVDFYNYSQEQDDYFQFMKNKKIAIVGPVDVGDSSGREINNFDVVIRFNYKGASKLGCEKIFGNKTNIGYYYFGDIPSDFDDGLFRAMQELDYVIVPEAAIRHYKWLQKLGQKVRPRYDVYPNEINPFLIGYANAVQRALIDIIRFPCREIKLFNANFYYSNNVSPEYGRTNFDLRNGFCYHEPVSNYIYIRWLWLNRWISVDKGVEAVLKLGRDKYIENMHKNYGCDIFSI